MAVKTILSPLDIHQIVSSYDFGTSVTISPIQQGTIQSNYCIEATTGKYIFRLYENRSFKSVLFERDLLLFLKDHQYPCPTPVPNQKGEYVGSCQGKPYLVVEFLDGEHIENLDAVQQREVIQYVAQLQVLTRNYQPEYKAHRWNYDIGLCQRLAEEAAQQINTLDAHRKYSWVEEQLSALDLPAALPKGICHCDFHYANLLFQDGVFTGLIDFDDANHTYLTFDLVCLIDGWAWHFPSERFNSKQARLITQAYEKCRPLSDLERHHLQDVHKLGILFDCVWFFGRGTANDFYERKKIENLDALGRDHYKHILFSS